MVAMISVEKTHSSHTLFHCLVRVFLLPLLEMLGHEEVVRARGTFGLAYIAETDDSQHGYWPKMSVVGFTFTLRLRVGSLGSGLGLGFCNMSRQLPRH